MKTALTDPGLIVRSLEIGKAMAERDRVALHAKGMCMYPLVRPGDLLHIQSRRVEQVHVGEIAACRRAGRLICHRVVDKDTLDKQPYVVTRSDRNRKADDGLTYDEDLLGIVTSIERNGRRVNPYNTKLNETSRFFLAVRRVFIELYYCWRERLFDWMSAVQRTTAYRTASRMLSRDSRRSARYEIRVWKESWRMLGLYMPLKPEEFGIDGSVFQGIPLNCWTLALHFGPRREPAARATFQYNENKWFLEDLLVRPRYRGMGLEKDLLLKAEEIFSRNGITDIDLNRFLLE